MGRENCDVLEQLAAEFQMEYTCTLFHVPVPYFLSTLCAAVHAAEFMDQKGELQVAQAGAPLDPEV